MSKNITKAQQYGRIFEIEYENKTLTKDKTQLEGFFRGGDH